MNKKNKVLKTLNKYAEDCLKDKILVGQQIKMACERHFKDLERKDIYWNEDAANRVISFCELMRHVKGTFARRKITLETWQKFFIGSVFGWYRKDSKTRRYREGHLNVARKNGKGAWVETPVYTPAGYKKLKDIHVGDIVFDENGNQCNVIAETGINYLDCYEVSFSNGEKIICDCEHLWKTTARVNMPGIKKGRAIGDTKTRVRNIQEIFLTQRYGKKGNINHSITSLKQTVQIVSVKRVPTVPTKCIQVDSPSNLYLIGKTMIPTHNSLIMNTIGHYGLVADNEMGAEILLAASKESQAKDIFNVALQMIHMNPEYKKFYGLQTTSETIRYPATGSYFTFVVGTPADGGNPSVGLVDELHQAKNNLAYEAIKNGQGARKQPLLIVASTAGMDFKCSYKRYVDYCHKVNAGVIEDDTLFSLEYSLDKNDDWKNFDLWIKANPNMGISVNLEFLQSQHKKALSDTASRSSILTKHCNIWNNVSSSWIDMAEWQKCAMPGLKMEDFKGEPCWVGIDLASRIDLCSLMFVFRRNGDYYTFGKHYINKERVLRPENHHFRAWESQGALITTDGVQTDFTKIEYDLKEFASDYQIQEIAYDPREATYLMQHIREWASFPCIEVSQSPKEFSEPMKVLEANYLSHTIHHNNDPLLNWAASNVVLKNSVNKLIYPAKRNQDDKIDPIVALVMALGRAELVHREADFSIFCV